MTPRFSSDLSTSTSTANPCAPRPDGQHASPVNGQATRPATEAQRTAARENGAKSAGPATPGGKARSSRNALRHGLTAKKLTPLDLSATDRRDYDKIFEGLVAEYEPRTQSQAALVEMAALDLVRVRRAVELQEALLHVDTNQREPYTEFRGDPEERWAGVVHVQEVFELLVDRLKVGVHVALAPDDAASVVNLIRATIRADREVLAAEADTGERWLADAGDPLDVEGLRRFYARIRPEQFLAQVDLPKLLTTGAVMAKSVRWRCLELCWRGLFNARGNVQHQAYEHGVRLDWRRRWRGHQLQQLPSIETALTYERRIRNQLERTLALLGEGAG